LPFRAKLFFEIVNDGYLPFNYHHPLMGWIYSAICRRNPKLATALHDEMKIKPFTYSDLWGKNNGIDKKKGFFYRKGAKLRFIFSSWDDEILSSFLNGIILDDSVEIADFEIRLVAVKTYQRTFENDCEKFVLLSPLILSVPVKRGEKLYHQYVSPLDGLFQEVFVKNLSKKYRRVLGREPAPVYVTPDESYVSRKRTSKLIDIKGTRIRGHIFPFKLCGDPDVIAFGYYAGFGERTAQGFGCVEVCTHDREGLRVE